MGATGIEWTKGPNGEPGFTFNPWIGCTKVSVACDNCYAETSSHKFEEDGPLWGPHANRRGVSESTWAALAALERRAIREGRRFRVFCASMADVLDNHKSIRQEWRDRLYAAVEATPHLDWLFLTKRPENAKKLLPATWFMKRGWPRNVWFGITGEDQERFDHRWLHACAIPAPVLFVSVEPMLGPLSIAWTCDPLEVAARILKSGRWSPGLETIRRPSWIICGGESGRLDSIRDTPLEHMFALHRQCMLLGIPFFMKQLPQASFRASYKRFDEFPPELRVRQQPLGGIGA